MELKEILKENLRQSSDLSFELSNHAHYLGLFEEAAWKIISCLNSGGKILTAGDSKSVPNSIKFCQKLSVPTPNNAKGFPIFCLSNPIFFLHFSGQQDLQDIYSNLISSLGQPGDIFFGITIDGNSESLIRACMSAKNNGMKVVLLTSDAHGFLQIDFEEYIDHYIKVPYHNNPEIIENLQSKVVDSLTELIENFKN